MTVITRRVNTMRKSVLEIIETIKALKGFTKDSEVADILGMGRGALSNAKKRNSLSFFDELVSFCDRENISLDFIRRDPFSTPQSVHTVNAPGGIDVYDDRFVTVEVYSISDGHSPGEPGGGGPIDSVVVPRAVYRESSLVVRINGDSMEKLIMDGSSAVIDTQTKEIVSGSVYAFKIPHEGLIIRECHSELSGLSLRPYNKNYPPSHIEWDQFDPQMVIGKVSCSVINVFR